MANPKESAARAATAGWPNGKPGNHRRGPVKGTKSGRRRGQLPAEDDPFITARRAVAAPLWVRGFRAASIRRTVNDWIDDQNREAAASALLHGLPLPAIIPHVSLDTVYRDHLAIRKQWQRDYLRDSQDILAIRVAGLQYAKLKLWDAFTAEKEGQEAERHEYDKAIELWRVSSELAQRQHKRPPSRPRPAPSRVSSIVRMLTAIANIEMMVGRVQGLNRLPLDVLWPHDFADHHRVDHRSG